MIQFNLLPDVKLQYLKVRRTQHLVITGSLIAIAISVFVLIVLISTVDILQKKNMSDLNRDIKAKTSQLTNTPNLSNILTVQSQLQSLTALHNSKPVVSRLFNFVEEITPSNVSITQLSTDFTNNTLTISGVANSLDIVKNYIETIKVTTYNGNSTHAFSSVVLSAFSRTASSASYTITANFDPTIFNNANNVTLTVPNIVTTPSALGQSGALFKNAGG